MQKRAVRTIAGQPYNAHTHPLFQDLNLLKLEDIYKVEVSKIMHGYKNHALPLPLMKLFILNKERHSRETRQDHDFYLKKCRTTLATQQVYSTGPKIWNALPTKIKNDTAASMKSFTKLLMNHFIHGCTV